MRQLLTKGVVLSRTDYGEANRIITVLTPEQGKLRLMARGVRKVKSKLAGGIELFSISEISYINGRGEIGTLISARLIKHYGKIIQDITRVQLGYELIKILSRATEDNPGPEYFNLLDESFSALDNSNVNPELILNWFKAQLLKYAGHMPNLTSDTQENKLAVNVKYNFDLDVMHFIKNENGNFMSDQIKVLRLLFSDNNPIILSRVKEITENLSITSPLIEVIFSTYIRR